MGTLINSKITDFNGKEVAKKPVLLSWDIEQAQKQAQRQAQKPTEPGKRREARKVNSHV